MFNTTTSSLFEQLPTMPAAAGFPALSTISLESESIVFAWQSVLNLITFSNAWKLLLILHIAANFKVFPFIYHLRILNGVRFVLRSQRPKEDVKPHQLFQPIITSSRSPLMEIDVYGHKSNSTYFADVDIARVHLVTTMFGRGIHKTRGSTTMNGLSKSSSSFRMAVGAVSCSFRRELLPYETYDMWTKVLSWDQKWFYLVTHFVKKGAKINPSDITLYPKQRHSLADTSEPSSRRRSNASTVDDGRSAVAATAVSKIVFKDGRKTILPNTMLEISGLMPSRDSENAAAQHKDLGSTSRRSSTFTDESTWTWETMEAERLRGLEVAQFLAQQTGMENEFTHDVALGRHHDGMGVEGVVSTLAQLAGLNKYQLL